MRRLFVVGEDRIRVNVVFDPMPNAEVVSPQGCRFKKAPAVKKYHSDVCQEGTTKALSKAVTASAHR